MVFFGDPPVKKIIETQEILDRIQSGDKLLADDLYNQYVRWINKKTMQYVKTGFDYSDIFSAANYGFTKALKSFDPNKGIKFMTFMAKVVENEILMFIKQYKKQDKEIPLNTLLNMDYDGNELTLEDVLYNPIDNLDAKFSYEDRIMGAILATSHKLSESHQRVLFEYLRTGKRQRALGDEMGISQSYVSRIEKLFLSIFKDELNKLDSNEMTFQQARKIRKEGETLDNKEDMEMWDASEKNCNEVEPAKVEPDKLEKTKSTKERLTFRQKLELQIDCAEGNLTLSQIVKKHDLNLSTVQYYYNFKKLGRRSYETRDQHAARVADKLEGFYKDRYWNVEGDKEKSQDVSFQLTSEHLIITCKSHSLASICGEVDALLHSIIKDRDAQVIFQIKASLEV